ncbi:MAG: ABC transporter permease [Thermoleophilia bacterium]
MTAALQTAIRQWRVLSQRPSAVVGMVLVVTLGLAVAFAPLVAPYDPGTKSGVAWEAPSWSHLSGTNDIGVDLFSELLYAGRISLFVGIVAASLVTVTGSVVGIVAGYFGGRLDDILMRITDVVLTLPRLPLMLVIAAYVGSGLWSIIFVIAIVGWTSLARQVRSQVLSVRESAYVESSRAIGSQSVHIMVSAILPSIAGVIVANGVMEIMFAILTEAGLSFLGLGDPTHKSWGVMLYFAQAQGAFLRGAWWWIFPPGISIAVFCLSFNLIGTAVNDLFGLKMGRR